MLRRTRSTPLQLCVGQSLDLHIPMKHVSNTKASGRAICDAGGGRGSTGARVAIAPCTSWGGSATAFLLQNTGCLSGNHGGVRSAYRLRTSKSLGVFAPAVAAVTGTLGLRGSFGRRRAVSLSTAVSAPCFDRTGPSPAGEPAATSGSSSQSATRPPQAPPITGYLLWPVCGEAEAVGVDATRNNSTYDDNMFSPVCCARQETSTHSVGSSFSMSPLLKFHSLTEPSVAAVMRRRPRKSSAAAVKPVQEGVLLGSCGAPFCDGRSPPTDHIMQLRTGGGCYDALFGGLICVANCEACDAATSGHIPHCHTASPAHRNDLIERLAVQHLQRAMVIVHAPSEGTNVLPACTYCQH